MRQEHEFWAKMWNQIELYGKRDDEKRKFRRVTTLEYLLHLISDLQHMSTLLDDGPASLDVGSPILENLHEVIKLLEKMQRDNAEMADVPHERREVASLTRCLDIVIPCLERAMAYFDQPDKKVRGLSPYEALIMSRLMLENVSAEYEAAYLWDYRDDYKIIPKPDEKPEDKPARPKRRRKRRRKSNPVATADEQPQQPPVQ